MKPIKVGWHILLAILILALLEANELGFGAVVLIPSLLLGCWLLTKIIPEEKPSH